MKPGDKIRVTWPDGTSMDTIYARRERGYLVFLDLATRKEVPCVEGQVTLEKISNQDDDNFSPKDRAYEDILRLLFFIILVGTLGYIMGSK